MADWALPFAAFEAYMRADDAPAHPMTALFEATYSGRLDRDRLGRALSLTLREHPLLRATIDRAARRPRWRISEDATPHFCYAEDDVPLRFPGDAEFIDLSRETGLRVWVRQGQAGGRIVFQFHHACTDGVGVTHFVLDVLRAYAFLSGVEAVVPPSREEALLRSRDRFFRYPLFNRLKLLASAARRTRGWHRSKPIPLSGAASGPSAQDRPMEAVRHRTLEPQELEGLLRAAHDADVTLNDLLLRDLFLVLAERTGRRAADECLSLCMPVNLREPTDAAMPAANKMMMTFLRRPPEACADADALLRSVRAETAFIKRTRRGVRLLEVMRLLLALHGEVPQSFLRKSCFATAVLSNLGRVGGRDAGLPCDDEGRLVCGDVTVDRIVTVPNGRPGTAAVFVVLTYAGRLTLCLRHDPSALTPTEADALLAAFADRLRLSAGELRESCAAA